ncbi:MAG: YHS domain-containing protein [Anaerolineae bacterium]|nr:YHS domain-containing protein [Phycisphaerae bacterium]
MLRSLLMSAILIAGSGFFVARMATAEPAKDAPTTAPSTQPANKMCAVMPDDAVDPKVTVAYKGKTIGFCCKDCIKDFEKDPEKYVKNMK